MKFNLSGLFLAASSAFILCASASGATITYTTYGTWAAAVGTPTSIDFNSGIADGTLTSFSTSAGRDFSNPAVNFSGYYNSGGGLNYWMYWADANNANAPAWDFGTGGLLAAGGGNDVPSSQGFTNGLEIKMGTNTGVRGVAFDFASLQYLNSNGNPVYPASGALQVEVKENGVWSTPQALSKSVNNTSKILTFVGIVSDGEISGVRISTRNLSGNVSATVILDNFAFAGALNSGGGGSTELPEPSTLVSVAAACLLLSFRLRRKQ